MVASGVLAYLFSPRILTYIEGILPKGPYLPCVSMAGRALLAGYHRYLPHISFLYLNLNTHANGYNIVVKCAQKDDVFRKLRTLTKAVAGCRSSFLVSNLEHSTYMCLQYKRDGWAWICRFRYFTKNKLFQILQKLRDIWYRGICQCISHLHIDCQVSFSKYLTLYLYHIWQWNTYSQYSECGNLTCNVNQTCSFRRDLTFRLTPKNTSKNAIGRPLTIDWNITESSYKAFVGNGSTKHLK